MTSRIQGPNQPSFQLSVSIPHASISDSPYLTIFASVSYSIWPSFHPHLLSIFPHPHVFYAHLLSLPRHQPPINWDKRLLVTQLLPTLGRLLDPLFHHREGGLQFLLRVRERHFTLAWVPINFHLRWRTRERVFRCGG